MPHWHKTNTDVEEPLKVGKLYQVRHIAFGSFVARVEEPHPGWCGFVVIEGNDKLHRQEIDNGSYIELTADFFRATPLHHTTH